MITRLSTMTAVAIALVAAAAFFAASARPAVAFGAPDASPPTGTLAGLRASASGTLELQLSASDAGDGLANAEATLDTASAFVRLGSGSCPEHPTPGTEPPPGAECPASVSAVPISLDTRAVPDGSHRLIVAISDGAGNAATLADRIVVVRNAAPASGTVATLTVGVSSAGEEGHPGKGKGAEKGKGKGKGLALRRKRCRAPHLTMRLARSPLWRTRPRHVAVLRYGRRYPYKGKLTCRAASGRRVPAPRGTPVSVYFRVWHLSFTRRHGPVKFARVRQVKVGRKGSLKLMLSFRSGRTVLFGYRGPRGELARAKLRLAVPPRTRRPPWGPR